MLYVSRFISGPFTRSSRQIITASFRAIAMPQQQKSPRTTPKKQAVAAPTSDVLLEKAARIAAQLQQMYPEPAIPLAHASPYQLLVAVMLSAQTTDKKVNEVTPDLFALAPDPAAMAQQDIAAVQKIIQPIGLAPTKAKNVVNMSKLLLERHAGEVPSSFDELEALPGVGHKTASVVMAQAFGQDAFPVDTHIHRLAERWGLSSGKSVEQTEADLMALLPKHTWRDVHLQIIYFGREHCPAKQHDSNACPICSWAAVAGSSSSKAATSKKAAAVKKANTPKRKAPGAAVAAATAAAAAAAATTAAVAAKTPAPGAKVLSVVSAEATVELPDSSRATRRRRRQ